MQMSARPIRSLDFPIGDKTYSVPPVGVDVGLRLAELFTTPQDKLAKTKLTTVQLFKLVLGDVWDEMRKDNVPHSEAFRVGMACLRREQALLVNTGPDRWDIAEREAVAIWESGIDPEALAAYMAATTQPGTGAATNRSTRRAAASTTRKTARGTGTQKTKTSASSTARGRQSRSRSSGASGR